MDWAEKLALDLMTGHDSEGVLDLTYQSLSAALRKAKADGWREALNVEQGDDRGIRCICSMCERMRNLANKIEKGET